jgi:uncharacterized delta-60 repeat protein
MKTFFASLFATLFFFSLAAQPGALDCQLAKGSSDFEFVLTRYNPDGSLNNTTTLDGKTAMQNGAGGYRCTDAPKAVVQADGKIVLVAGVSLDGRDSIAVFRFGPDGSPDTGFGRGGVAILGFNPYYNYPGVVAVDGSGRILVAGSTVGKEYDEAAGESFYFDRLVVARLNPDGAYDRAFGDQGFVQTDIGDMETPIAITIQPDGDILTEATIRVYGKKRYEEATVVLRIPGGDAAGVVLVNTEGK